MQIYMQYPHERTVQSVVKKSVFEGRGFGAKMTVEQLIAKQTRIERWESVAMHLCCFIMQWRHILAYDCSAFFQLLSILHIIIPALLCMHGLLEVALTSA